MHNPDLAEKEKKDLPTRAKLAHVLATVLAGAIALCVSAVLADGTSVIKLKDPSLLPIVTNISLRSEGIYYRLDQLLGNTYGIGLHHDQSGRSWNHIGAGKSVKQLVHDLGIPVIAGALPSVISTDGLKHPVPLLGCADLLLAGNTAMGFGFIALTVAIVMIAFHALVLAQLVPAKLAKPIGGLIWFTLSAGFLIVILLAVGIYTSVWTCDQIIIPQIKLSEHFEYNYGFAFAVLGFCSSLLALCGVLCFTATTDGEPGAAKGAHLLAPSVGCQIVKALGGITFGAIVAACAVVAVLGAANNFEEAALPDPAVNPCEGKKRTYAGPGDDYFSNVNCIKNEVVQVLEQSGANVTRGYRGGLHAGDRVPITVPYSQTDLCPVNVHWHLGAEHLSMGQYDYGGKGPPTMAERSSGESMGSASGSYSGSGSSGRRLAGSPVTLGLRCHHYTPDDNKFTEPYNWQHCTNMVVGETYEVHWPHSAAGDCGTKWQYQTPFYDGVFCHDGVATIAPLNTYDKIGVQGQVFTIVNSDDPAFYHPNLIDGMIVDGGARGSDMAFYTGSTTGTSRDNNICSRYAPITWQVDRKCHMISASSFDKMCADMKAIGSAGGDDMSGDLYPHGAREVTAHHITADNQQSRA